MGFDRVVKCENQGLQHGSLDSSHYRFPSSVRQGIEGFRHGGRFLNIPSWQAAASQLARLRLTESFTATPELFFFYLHTFSISAFFISCFLILKQCRLCSHCRMKWPNSHFLSNLIILEFYFFQYPNICDLHVFSSVKSKRPESVPHAQ